MARTSRRAWLPLTLLTVTLLGLLVLRLMEQILDRQANDYLNANAQAVARQSQLLFQPAPQRIQLHRLAQTAAFLGDVQVRILDNERQVLADSGLPGDEKQWTWIVSDLEPATAAGEAGASFVAAAPVAKAIKVSEVDVSPSMVMALKVSSAPSANSFCNTRALIGASVKT